MLRVVSQIILIAVAPVRIIKLNPSVDVGGLITLEVKVHHLILEHCQPFCH